MTARKAPLIVRALRRVLLPAVVAGVLSNLAVYRMLGAEGALTDWKSTGVMAAIALVGLLTGGWAALRIAERLPLPAAGRLALFEGAAIVTGGLLALAIANMIVDEGQLGYMKYGLAAGAVGGLVWILINFDLAAAPGNRRYS